MTGNVKRGSCVGCDRLFPLYEDGEKDRDLTTDQPEEALWLVNEHMGFAGNTCFGSGKNPIYMVGESVLLPEPLDIGSVNHGERHMPLQDNNEDVGGPLLP